MSPAGARGEVELIVAQRESDILRDDRHTAGLDLHALVNRVNRHRRLFSRMSANKLLCSGSKY
jgi:hypothetical protein